MDGAELRAVLLRVVDELSRQDRGSLQAGVVLQQAARHLGLHRRGIEDQQALLAFFYDLFRTGYLSWGMDLANQAPPFCHVTALGRQALAHHSRDPANPDGYLAYLASRASIGHVTRSYVSEALQTFNAACFKATAVLIGAAAESVIMEVRDALTARLTALGRSGSQDLRHRLIKRVLAGIRNEILSQKRTMSVELFERFESHWPSFSQQIRTARNDAGHPVSITPVTSDQVHASLLIFPELVALAADLKKWINSQFS